MRSLTELYRIGPGPSSSHTMGPRFAAGAFARKVEALEAALGPLAIRVTLFGSLSATGKGHLTDLAVTEPFGGRTVDIIWSQESLPHHPNGMTFQAIDSAGQVQASTTCYSVGGGALMDQDGVREGGPSIYTLRTMDDFLARAEEEGVPLWKLVELTEGPAFRPFLQGVWAAMVEAISRGLDADGLLPGTLRVPRKAASYHHRATSQGGQFQSTGLLFSYALAVSEENASGHTVVTAPTCGGAGVVPAVLRHFQVAHGHSEPRILNALATAGLVGNLAKHNASISGAEVGCQGEVGVACAMAAAAACQLMGGSIRQVEYAAEMGLEHHLGLTCDPIGGYVQIPCIERNAIAAVRAVDCAVYVMGSDGRHIVSFDEVLQTMYETGKDMLAGYRETSTAGLAKIHRHSFPGMGS